MSPDVRLALAVLGHRYAAHRADGTRRGCSTRLAFGPEAPNHAARQEIWLSPRRCSFEEGRSVDRYRSSIAPSRSDSRYDEMEVGLAQPSGRSTASRHRRVSAIRHSE